MILYYLMYMQQHDHKMKYALCTYCNRCGDAPASIDHGLSGFLATCLLCLCQGTSGLLQLPPGYLLPH